MRNKRDLTRLTPERVEGYRQYEPRPIGEQIEALNQFGLHQALFTQVGESDLAEAVQRAWLQDAVGLATTLAATAQDAHLKITYLQSCLEGWVAPTAKAKGHMARAAMIGAGIAVEARRWGFGSTTTTQTH